MSRDLNSLESELGLSLAEVGIEEVALQNHPCFSMAPLGGIEGLNLSNLRLGTIPKSIARLKSLKVLRLHGNLLTELPPWLAELNSLRRLYLADNMLQELPVVIPQMTNLEVLALNLNDLQNLDPAIAQLKNLRKLGLSGNRLSELPASIATLHGLQSLFLGSNQLKQVPPWIINLAGLEELTLARNHISHLPKDFHKLSSLVYLGLQETHMRTFPSQLLALRSLCKLDLSGIPFTELPSGIGQLCNLVSLDLNGTQIDRLPADFIQLQKLKHLNLSSLRLPDIPSSIFRLKNLEDLNLSGTRVRAISKDIASLTNLNSLDLSGMGLTSVPPEVFRLPSLKRLNLVGNRLRELPWQVTQCPLEIFWTPHGQTGGLFVGGNPLESPPPEIVHSGMEAVQSYFQSLQGRHKPIDEVKVLLVGDGGAGKTSLVKRLLGREFDEHESQTHGINIEDFTILSRGKRLKVHFWDFGGQEIMHATHQFFLSKRSAYLLVLDGRKDEKTEYWLKHIEAFGGDSPILIILNKVDQNASFDVNRRFLAEKYPSIKGFLRVSCRTGEGIRDLLEALSRTLVRIEHTKTHWALSWFNVKQRLESMEEDFISYSRYQEICIEQGIEEVVIQTTLVDFLHDLGVVLHFRDLPLKDTNVINPRWVTDGVYRIVNSKEVASLGGVLHLDLLQDILDPHIHPPDRHNFIIELMKKFELCYALDRENVLLPGLLPVEEPDAKFSSDRPARFVIDYDFLPKSIMPRFIVRMHEDIDQGYRWRTGVILYNRQLDTRALIRTDEVERRIAITVVGIQRRDYLGIILFSFRKINESFEKLAFTEKIPMPDAPDVTVSYSHLVLLESRGIRSFIPDGSEREYDVQELLGWIKPQRKTEDEILEILQALREKGDSEETLLEKANRSVLLQPNFFGLGVNINELIKRMSKRR